MRRLPLLVLVAALFACQKIGSGGATTASAPDSIAALNAQLAQAHAVSSQQDSLLQGFNQTTQLLADIDTELSKVKGLKSHVPLDVKGEGNGDTQAAYRASLLGKVKEVTGLLRKSRARAALLAEKNKGLDTLVTQYEQTISNFETMVAQKNQEIAALTSKVDSLSTANTTLASANAAIADTVKTLRTEANTVYYVVGTKDELKKKGIIVEEGSKFLFFGHKALVPARTLDPSAFTAMNKWDDAPITLHIAGKPFKVISRQDASLIESAKTPDGQPSGELHITSPADFWGPSKYLIIVEGA